MKNIITSENIVKTFVQGSEQFRALDGVSVGIGAGEFVAVMGPSGSGKTTLMFALSGMDIPRSGSVRFSHLELSGLKDDVLADIRRQKMGFVFQQPTMLRNLNILDNIILPSMRDHRRQARALAKKAQELMQKTGIAGLEGREITQVSGGQLQRAGICRALMNNPEIIFGDEPTGALNSKAADEIMDILTEINAEGTAVMLVTHDPKVAVRAGRVLFMRDGKIVSELQLEKFRREDLDSRTKAVSDRI